MVCLATNKIAPDYMGVELGIGDSIMIKAVSETCGMKVCVCSVCAVWVCV